MTSLKPILIIEDSSKSSLGGGQSVTLEFIDYLLEKACHKLIVLDHFIPTRGETRFAAKFSNALVSVKFLRVFPVFYTVKPSSTRSTLSLSVFEFLTSPFLSFLYSGLLFFVYTYTWILFGQRPQVYSATKKSLLYCLPLAFIGVDVLYHSHNVSASGASQLIFNFFCSIIRPSVIAVSREALIPGLTSKSCIIANPCPVLSYDQDQILRSVAKKATLRYTEGFSIASFSNHIAWKGLDTFLKAINLITHSPSLYGRTLTDQFFSLYGSGPETANLKLLATELEIDQSVFKGFINDVPSHLFENVGCLILPSTAPEACPMVLIEALSLGIPVLSARIGAQYDLLPSDLKLLAYNPYDSDSLACAIEFIMGISDSDYINLCSSALRASVGFSRTSFRQNLDSFLRLS